MAEWSSEVERLSKLYIKTEQDILAAISYKLDNGQISYAEFSALDQVEDILRQTIDKSNKILTTVVEKYFKAGARHRRMSIMQYPLIDIINTGAQSQLTIASLNVSEYLRNTWNESVSNSVFSNGQTISQAQAHFLEEIKKNGITAFIDKTGKKWNFRTYANMITRTAARQAANIGTLYINPEHDLYQISSHATVCNICAPLEGRVYSKSGTNPNYPPLALAFGKIDKNGPNTLDNSWLNIHPNCLHVLTEYVEAGKTEDEITKLKEFSSFKINPPTVDPRPASEILAYKRKEATNRKLLQDYNQFRSYKLILGKSMPKTFKTFMINKLNNSNKYQAWQTLYRQMNQKLKNIDVGN